MKLALGALGLLFGTTMIIGCGPGLGHHGQYAQSPSDQVGTTQLTSADAPLPPPPRRPLLGWYGGDAPMPAAPAPLDTSDPWQPAAPEPKAAAPAAAPAAPEDR